MLLFLILQNDDDEKEGRISAKGESGCTIHYTEKRNDVGEFCTLVRELEGSMDYGAYGYDYGFFEYMSDFHKRSLHIFYRSLNVTISRQTHGKVQTTYILLIYVYRANEVTGLHTPARQRHVINHNKSADWSTAHLASGFPSGNRSRSDRARYRSGVTQK